MISCIDGGFLSSAFFLSVITTIDCPGAVLTNNLGPVLTIIGTSSQVVILRNLTFDAGPQNAAPFISVTGGATLIIENCKFQNIANNNAIAIQFLPSSPAAQLVIRDSVFANNGIAPSTGGGLQVAPASGGSASVLLERVSFNFNVTSVVLSGPVNATMIDSTVSASRNTGIIVGSGATLHVKDSTLEYNVGSAISVAAGATVRLSNNDILNNQIGISNSGGQALTYSNNHITGNGSTATLTPIQGGQ
jgi:Right handed beta helix region